MPSGIYKRSARTLRMLRRRARHARRFIPKIRPHSKETIRNIQIGVNKPEAKQRHKKGLVNCWERESYRKNWHRSRRKNQNNKKIAAANRKRARTPKFRKRFGSMVKDLWRSRKHRNMVRESQRTTTARRNYSRASRKMHKRPEMKEFFGAHLKKVRVVTNGKPSKVHISIFRSLCRRAIRGQRFEYQVGSRSIDIAFPKLNLAFEIDGAYWHRDKLHKRRRDRFLRHQGWKVVHLPAEFDSVFKILEEI